MSARIRSRSALAMWLACAVFALSSAKVSASSNSLVNPSFESGDAAWNPAVAGSTSAFGFPISTPPDGTRFMLLVGYPGGGMPSISQDAGVVVPGAPYNLSFYSAPRSDSSPNNIGVYGPLSALQFTASLVLRNGSVDTEIASAYVNPDLYAPGSWVQTTLSGTVPANATGNIVVKFLGTGFRGNNNQQTGIDMVVLAGPPPPPVNQPPVANAGADQTVEATDPTTTSVTLDGTGSSDPDSDALSYTWSENTTTIATGATIQVGLGLGNHTIILSVDDGKGGSASDQVAINVVDTTPPSITPPDAVTVETTDPNGAHVQLTPPAATDLVDQQVTVVPLTALPEVFPVGETTVIWQAFDSSHNESRVSQTVTVVLLNRPPVADAGSDQTAYVGDTVTLEGRHSSDPDGDALSYYWQVIKVQGFTDNGDGTASFTPSAPGEYTFTLVVDDGQGGSASDEVVVTVPNRPPVANAGPDQAVNVGDTVTLDGSASSDPDGSTGLQPGPKKGPKGFGLQYFWAQTGGPQPVEFPPTKPGFGGPAAISFQVTAPGIYTFSLVVNDGELDSAPDEVVVTVINPNQPPVADAGPDQTVECAGLLTSVALSGVASSDPDGDGLSYNWSENGAPLASEVTATVALSQGTHTLTLTVNDGQGETVTDQVVVNIVDTTPPTLTLNGADPLVLELGTSYPESGATATDICCGNPPVTLPDAADVDVDTEGTYTLTYSTTDPSGNSASATRTVQVVVTPNSYGLIATHSLHLRQHARITSGFAGVVNRGQAPFLAGKTELVVGTSVQTAPQVRLSAPRVRVRKGATIAGELVYNELVSVDRRATIAEQEQVGPGYFPLFQGFGLPTFQTGTPGTQDVEVRQKGSTTLNPGSYDEVRVKQKGTLTFSGGTYQLGDLEVGQQAKVIFLAPTTLLIRGQLSLDQKASFGPGAGLDASDILIYVEGHNGRLGSSHDDDEGDDEEDDAEGRRLRKSPRSVKVGEQASFQGNLYAPNGTLHLRQGSTAVGSFIARDLIIGVRAQVAAQSGWNTPGVIYQPQTHVAKLAGEQGAPAALPTETGLLANYPNPFNPATTVPYVLGTAAQVKLSVYNVLGQQIRVLVDQLQVPGSYVVSWDGMDTAGLQAAGGVYFYRLQAGDHIQVRKMLFAK